MHIGEEIEWVRCERMMSQRELAERVGVKRYVISEIETGQREPTKSILRDICNVLDVDESDLV